MIRKVQIAPVGFEFDRIIEGVVSHPSNVIYLLKSYKKTKNGTDPDRKLIAIANKFVEKLFSHFQKSKICQPIIVETEIITLENIIKELCLIIKTELEEKNAEEIWINISTSTKLFVSAAMYVGSFKPDFIRLFYIDASDYIIINSLFNSEKKKEDIISDFIKYGMTMKKNERSYRNVDVPLYPAQILSDPKKQVLINLFNLEKNNSYKKTKYKRLLKELKEDPDDKSIKMKYSHHIKNLKKRNLVREDIHGREKLFYLTQEGRILGLILDCFN